MKYVDTAEIKSLALSLNNNQIIVFDTETTGLGRDDEVLQISAVDGAGHLVINEYLKPMHKTSWPEAQEIHGIAPQTVAYAPTIAEIVPKLDRIFSSASLIIAYNIEFDDRMLRQSGYSIRHTAPTTPCIDVMLDYAAIVKEPRGDEYKWQTLKNCADHYQIAFSAHDSSEDARATALCFQRMLHDTKYQEHVVIPQNISETKSGPIPHVRIYESGTGKNKGTNVTLRFPSSRAFKRFMALYPKSDGVSVGTTGEIIAWDDGCAIVTDGKAVAAMFDGQSEEFKSLKTHNGEKVKLFGREVCHGTVAKLYLTIQRSPIKPTAENNKDW